jgi:hypothetical protein
VRELKYASRIIKACCTLHNFLLSNREPDDPYLAINEEDVEEQNEDNGDEEMIIGYCFIYL